MSIQSSKNSSTSSRGKSGYFFWRANGLLRSSRSASGPCQFALLGVELHACTQQVPEDVAGPPMDFWPSASPSTQRAIGKGLSQDTVLRLFPGVLAHEVLKQVWAASRPFCVGVARRVLRDIHCAVKTPELLVASDFRKRGSSRRIRIMSPNMVNEL